MPPQWNSSGLLGGPERRHGDRRLTDRGTSDRRRNSRRRRIRTAVLAAAMSSAPMARPMIALLPPKMVKPRVEVSAEFTAVPPHQAYDAFIDEAATTYDMDPNLALASYNAGPGNVERYGGVPPFRETRNYIKTIKQILAAQKKSADAD